jgi:hypothetical protein
MSDAPGGVLFVPVVLISVGGIMVYSAIKGLSVLEVFSGAKGDALNPRGGSPYSAADLASPTPQQNSGGSAQGVPGAGGAFGAPSIGGFSSGSSIDAEQNRMISLHHAYKWGGGHASFSQNGPWDCSGAVSWLVHYIGVPINRPLVSTEFMSQGKPGRGQVFTIYANPAHVFLYMESGPHAGKCWGTTSRLPSQGGSLAWHDHTTVGFVARHYEGW